MLTYNTQRKKLPLPEYGRNLQKMVDYCMALPERDKRNECARTIIRTMATLFPQPKDPNSNPDAKYWDLLAIMSGFELDIDWPEGTVNAEKLREKPQAVPMTQGPMKFSIYGKNLQRMMEYAIDMPGGPEKDEVILLLAEQMKKQLTAISPDNADDARVFKDIAAMTAGEIRMDPQIHKLHEFRVIKPSTKKKKRK